MHVCSYLWMTFLVPWMAAALRTKRAAERIGFSCALVYGIPVTLAYYCMFGPEIDIAWFQHRLLPKTPQLAIVGIVITLAGMAFAVWARVYLGSNWSSAPMIKQQHQLIRTGPDRIVLSGTRSTQDSLPQWRARPWQMGRPGARWPSYLFGSAFRSRAGWKSNSCIALEYEDYRRSTGALFPRFLA